MCFVSCTLTLFMLTHTGPTDSMREQRTQDGNEKSGAIASYCILHDLQTAAKVCLVLVERVALLS